MQTKQLGNSDMHITPIGIGAWAMGGGGWAFGWGPHGGEAGRRNHFDAYPWCFPSAWILLGEKASTYWLCSSTPMRAAVSGSSLTFPTVNKRPPLASVISFSSLGPAISSAERCAPLVSKIPIA